MARRSPASVARRNNAIVHELHDKFQKNFAQKNYQAALLAIRSAVKLVNAPELAANEMLCLARMGRFEEAYALSKKLPAEKLGVNYADVATEICGQLGKAEEVSRYGALALNWKNTDTANEPTYTIPAGPPPAFDGSDPSRNIISFSLYGKSPRYCEVAVMNCIAAAKLLPGWRCRFYTDGSIPPEITARLREHGGEVVIVDELAQQKIHPLMWRMLVLNDPHMQRFLMRDADSLIGLREQAAVNEWLASDKWFHVMRDWFSHTELILAGMWGGCAGVFKNIDQELIRFIEAGQFALSHIDQHFLRKRVWPTVRQSVLSHDSQFKFFNNQPFPAITGEEDSEISHIGKNLGTGIVAAQTQAPDNSTLRWTIFDADGKEVCSYRTVVKKGAWEEIIPNAYATNIEHGLWTIKTEVEAS